MTVVHHLNCGTLHAPPNPPAACHCLLLEDANGLTLVDTGIGLLDVQRPFERIGREVIDAAGFQFVEQATAVRQIESLGFRARDVRQIVLTHCDPDHAGGLADFPHATVHVAEEELASLRRGNPRYATAQFDHEPRWHTHATSDELWFGLEARPLALEIDADLFLVPLFGHTLGHCGVAISQGNRWVMHVGDAYYLRVELETDDHPVSQLAAMRADDDAARRSNVEHLRRLVRDHAKEITLFGYHDFSEFPQHGS